MFSSLLLTIPIAVLSALYFPEQVHISLWNDDTSMAVTWAADYVSSGAQVQYTPVSSKTALVTSFNYSSTGVWTTFPNNNYSRILQRHLHTCKAIMINLIPGQLYRYRVGSEVYGWSQEFNFHAKRNFTDNPVSRFLVYGDLGVGPQIDVTMLRLALETDSVSYDGIIHNGDFAYDLDSEMGETGDQFMRAIEPIASQLPYMVSEGNHEGGSTIVHYYHRFNMPGNSSNLYYSFNVGKIHFISYSTEFLFDNWTDLQAAQNAFIQQDLATYDRKAYPWLVVFGHRPFTVVLTCLQVLCLAQTLLLMKGATKIVFRKQIK